MTDTQIEQANEVIARFDGWEKVRVGYYGEHNKDDEWNESEWQLKNSSWMDKVGLEDVGQYFVKINEDVFIPVDELKYHSDWNQLMDCWKKLRSTVWQTNDGGYPVEFMLFFERWKRECFNGFIKECHQILYEAIIWYNNTQSKQQ